MKSYTNCPTCKYAVRGEGGYGCYRDQCTIDVVCQVAESKPQEVVTWSHTSEPPQTYRVHLIDGTICDLPNATKGEDGTVRYYSDIDSKEHIILIDEYFHAYRIDNVPKTAKGETK